MRLFLAPLIVWMLFNAGIDFYIYHNLSKRFPNYPALKWIQAVTAALLLVMAIVAICLPVRSGDEEILRAVNWLLFIYITFYIPKYLYFLVDLISLIPRCWQGKRWKWLSFGGFCMAGVLFSAFWWGAVFNRYNIRINEVEIGVTNLPRCFNGYRMLQFSDFHVGTYGNDTTFVSKVVDIINDLNPDLILFTGDIVNRHTKEIEPFVSVLARLKAPDGVKVILGNHDYGDYYTWSDSTAKEANMNALYRHFEDMGWTLLRNRTDWIVRGNDSLAIIGVENIGDPPFPIYGSLVKAYPSVEDSFPKILLTHNPAHWVDSIQGYPEKNIALTLSGHTHAMQIEIAGWSPAKWRYKTWGGEYEAIDKERKLYVNIGLGTVGLPMRLGANPELTLITLRTREGKE